MAWFEVLSIIATLAYAAILFLHQLLLRRRVRTLDARVCEICDRVGSIGLKGGSPEPAPSRESARRQSGEPLEFRDGRSPPDVSSWVSQLGAGRKL